MYEPAPFGMGDRLLAAMLATLVTASIVFASCAHRPARIDDDLALARRVESRLEMDSELRAFGITVAATDGVVVLRGRVEDDADRQRAEAIAAGTPGAAQVVDALGVVSPPLAVNSPFRDEWVATRVKARLVASREVDASAVTVATDRGRVVLSGRVGSTRDRRAAEAVAREVRGVTEVDNRIQVVPRDDRDPA